MNDIRRTVAFLLLFTAFAVALVYNALWQGRSASAGVSFLDVGQGDSELALFRSGASLLVDAGPDRSVVEALDKILPRRHIDLVVLTHAQKDHIGGLPFILERYDVGAVIYNSAEEGSGKSAWEDTRELLRSKSVPLILCRAGDRIKIGQDEARILYPPTTIENGTDLNESVIVLRSVIDGISYLFMADAGFPAEKALGLLGKQLRSDVLKVGHHGSKYSSSALFLDAVKPSVSVIEVGSKNSYGHPTVEALRRLEGSGARVYRTDKGGTTTIQRSGTGLRVFQEHPQGTGAI